MMSSSFTLVSKKEVSYAAHRTRRRIVLVACVLTLTAVVGLVAWQARAQGQSECIWECVDTDTCFGDTINDCSGCVAVYQETCTSKQGKWEWSQVQAHGTTMGDKKVKWQMIHCATHYPREARLKGNLVCHWFLGLCGPEWDSLPCYECWLSDRGFPYWAADAVCEDCPPGS